MKRTENEKRLNNEILNNPKNYIYAAKRLKAAERRHLYVNALQAKHIPARGGDALALFDNLAEELRKKTEGKRLLIIGFAETATAIGARLAEKAAPNGYFTTTTREYDPNEDYIEFSESHSHAKQQLLNVRGLSEAVKNTERIVFAEDEITTGKTIEKLIDKLNERYPDKKPNYTIASVLNSLSIERAEALTFKGIDCVCLHKIKPDLLAETLDNYDFSNSGNLFAEDKPPDPKVKINYIGVPYKDQRAVSETLAYSKAAHSFAKEAVGSISLGEKDKNILILGTEEFMYPAVLTSAVLGEKYPDKNVLTHSTTRSPIEVCTARDYPLNNRTSIISLYEKGRQNFVYNVKPYDRVFVLTDAQPKEDKMFGEFASSLSGAEVEFMVWREKKI